MKVITLSLNECMLLHKHLWNGGPNSDGERLMRKEIESNWPILFDPVNLRWGPRINGGPSIIDPRKSGG